MNVYAIYLISVVGWILTRRAMHQDDVCKYLAIEFFGEEDKASIKSTWAALTDPKQNIWAFLGWALILLSGYLKWSDAGALSAFIMVGISMFAASMFGLYILPKPSEPKCMADVLKSLYRRKAEFEKKHDVMRAQAIDFYIEKVDGKFKNDLSNAANLYAKNHKENKSKVSNNEIIGSLGDLMQKEYFDISAIYDVKELSYSKTETLRALCEELKNTRDEKLKGLLSTGLLITCRCFDDIGQPLTSLDEHTINEMSKLFENVNSVEDASKVDIQKAAELWNRKKPFDEDKYNKFSKQSLIDFNAITEKIGLNKIDGNSLS